MPLILMDVAPIHATGAVNGLNIMMRQVGSAIAGVVGAIVLASTLHDLHLTRDTFTWLFGVGAACGLVAAGAMLPWRRPPRTGTIPLPADIERTPR